MSAWEISKAQYDRLLYYMGCGNLPEADVLFLGNEEGAGGFNIECNVEARYSTFGTENGKLTYAIDASDYTQGYWEPSAIGGRDKKVAYLRSQGLNPEVRDFWRSAFLIACARVCNILESGDIAYWNQSTSNNEPFTQTIKSYILSQLFQPRDGIQSALIDLRHLPRENESVWYEREYRAICSLSGEQGGLKPSNNPYLNAYRFPRRRGNLRSSFSDFSSDVDVRLKIVKKAITFTRARVVIAFGGASGFKKEALERMFGRTIFEPMPIQSSRVSYYAKLDLDGKITYLYLVPFPDPSYVFKGADNLQNFMTDFTTLLMSHTS